MRPFKFSSLTSILSQLIVLFSLSILSAQAQSIFNLDTLSQGELILNLSATEQREVEQDTLHASLQYSVQGRDRINLQSEVNQVMTEALALLESSNESGLDYSTQRYQVYIIQAGRPSRNDVENPVWRAQQSIQLSSKNSEAVLDMAGALQELGLTMNGLNYSLSVDRYQEVSDSLMTSALEKLQHQADTAAESLSKGSANLIEVNLNGSQNVYFRARQQPMAMMESDMAISTPVAEPGNTQVSLTVSARALLTP